MSARSASMALLLCMFALGRASARAGQLMDGAMIGVFGEAQESDRAGGLVMWFDDPRGHDWFGYGLSLQRIRSPRVTYLGQQDNLTSLFGTVHVAPPWVFAPYLEAGVDLGDWFAVYYLFSDSEVRDPQTGEPAQLPNIIDTSLAAGWRFTISNALSLRVYRKQYQIRQEERTTRFYVTGAGLAITF